MVGNTWLVIKYGLIRLCSSILIRPSSIILIRPSSSLLIRPSSSILHQLSLLQAYTLRCTLVVGHKRTLSSLANLHSPSTDCYNSKEVGAIREHISALSLSISLCFWLCVCQSNMQINSKYFITNWRQRRLKVISVFRLLPCMNQFWNNIIQSRMTSASVLRLMFGTVDEFLYLYWDLAGTLLTLPSELIRLGCG